MQVIHATIIDVDFLPSYGFEDSIFLLWVKTDTGDNIIVETFGSKKELIKKFQFAYFDRNNWDFSTLISRKCEIEMKSNAWIFKQFNNE